MFGPFPFPLHTQKLPLLSPNSQSCLFCPAGTTGIRQHHSQKKVAAAKKRLKSQAAVKTSVESQVVQLRGGIWVQWETQAASHCQVQNMPACLDPFRFLCTRKSCPFCRPTHKVVSSAQLEPLGYGSTTARKRSRQRRRGWSPKLLWKPVLKARYPSVYVSGPKAEGLRQAVLVRL